MNDQPYLPWVRGSSTSRTAAVSLAKIASGGETMVHRYISYQGRHGATDDEVEEALGLRHQTASARRRGLVLKHRIVDSGMKRRTSSGRLATVWVVDPSKGC